MGKPSTPSSPTIDSRMTRPDSHKRPGKNHACHPPPTLEWTGPASLLANKEEQEPQSQGQHGVVRPVPPLSGHTVLAPFKEARKEGSTGSGRREDSKSPSSGTPHCAAGASPARLPWLVLGPQQSRCLCPSPYQGSRAYSSMAPASGGTVRPESCGPRPQWKRTTGALALRLSQDSDWVASPRQTQGASHWTPRITSSFHCSPSVFQLRFGSGIEYVVVCFGGNEWCGPGDQSSDERKEAVLSTCPTVLVTRGGGGMVLQSWRRGCIPLPHLRALVLPTQQSLGEVG